MGGRVPEDAEDFVDFGIAREEGLAHYHCLFVFFGRERGREGGREGEGGFKEVNSGQSMKECGEGEGERAVKAREDGHSLSAKIHPTDHISTPVE